jgi:hypothetical protein
MGGRHRAKQKVATQMRIFVEQKNNCGFSGHRPSPLKTYKIAIACSRSIRLVIFRSMGVKMKMSEPVAHRPGLLWCPLTWNINARLSHLWATISSTSHSLLIVVNENVLPDAGTCGGTGIADVTRAGRSRLGDRARYSSARRVS